MTSQRLGREVIAPHSSGATWVHVTCSILAAHDCDICTDSLLFRTCMILASEKRSVLTPGRTTIDSSSSFLLPHRFFVDEVTLFEKFLYGRYLAGSCCPTQHLKQTQGKKRSGPWEREDFVKFCIRNSGLVVDKRKLPKLQQT